MLERSRKLVTQFVHPDHCDEFPDVDARHEARLIPTVEVSGDYAGGMSAGMASTLR